VLHVRLNPRVIAAAPAAPILDEMRLAGASEPGILRMMTKAESLALAMERVERRQANLLKQEMLAAGGDCAVAHGTCAEQIDETSVVLVGTRRQFDDLIARLADEPFDLPAVGEALRAALDAYARRRFVLRLSDRQLELGPRVAIMGVVNVTPDSFSDGGECLETSAAVERGLQLVEEGADILDIGGESTRPGSDPVPEDVELSRVIPVIEGLAEATQVPLSIDTRRARVAREAAGAGARIINDVTGLLGDPAMPRTAAETGAAVVVMHILGQPKTMQSDPQYVNLMADICRTLRRGLAAAVEAGVADDRLIVDPGIGFGKTLDHNLRTFARLGELRTLGCPILVGPSRKRFIGQLTGVETPADRTCGTAAACALAIAAGALLVRVHDVRIIRQAVAVAAAVAQSAENPT